MATYTGNLNLKKPSLDDDALITDINNNMDILDTAANGIQDALAIVANGNTHAAITSGQFVYVRNHNTLTEGLYVASSNIAANATLSSSNLAADSKGGLNALSAQIANKVDVGASSVKIRYGVAIITAGTDRKQIDFGITFTNKPTVVLTPVNDGNGAIVIVNFDLTKSSVVALLRQGTITYDQNVHWIAIGV